MYVLDFLKDGDHLYTITSKRGTVVHQQLLQAFEEYNKLLLLQRQRLSFFSPIFVLKVWEICVSDKFFSFDIVPDRVDVKYLR